MRRIALIALGIGMLGAAGPASAMTTITNHELLPEGTTSEQCLARAEAAISGAGLRLLQPTCTARWGQNASGSEIYTIYCVPDRAAEALTKVMIPEAPDYPA